MTIAPSILENDSYILAGKVDLLLGGDGKLELLDFKTSPRPKDSPKLIAAYERQLCTYAHILERRHALPDKPRSSKQRYRITPLGLEVLKEAKEKT